MIDRQYGNLVFECDSCDETFEADTDDFNDAWGQAKYEGFTTRKFGDVWAHACGKCKVPA